MKTISKILISIIVLLQYLPSQAQFQEGWEYPAIYRGITQHNDNELMDIAIDNSGYVYVTGMCDNPPQPNPYCEGPGAGTNICTKKYDSSGDTIWTNRIFGCGEDDVGGNAIATYTDVQNNTFVYVTGKTLSESSGRDIIIIKYNASDGSYAWNPPTRTYGGSGSDEAVDIEVDANGNAYVTGLYKNGIFYDYVTIKYNSNGDRQWATLYNGRGQGNDIAYSLSVDLSGNVYVTGRSYGGASYDDEFATIKYYPNGQEHWVKWYNGPSNSEDYGADIAVYTNHGVYVTGKSTNSGQSRTTTIMYSPGDGYEYWVNDDETGIGNSIGIYRRECIGNAQCFYIDIFITGKDNYGNGQTIRYNEEGSIETGWPRTFRDAENFTSLAIDPSENVFVFGSADNTDYLTVEYNSSGTNLGYLTYSSYGISYPKGIVTDEDGNVYVAGYNYYDPEIQVASQYLIIKYIPSGNFGPNNLQNPTGNGNIIKGEIPKEYYLGQNYPNPFNPVTLIKYGIPEAGLVKITVYDILGQEVSQLVNEYKEPGYHDVKFDGPNLPSGIYIYKIYAPNFTETKKMVLIK